MRQYEAYEDVANRFVNWSLHSSGLGYFRSIDEVDDVGRAYATLGPSPAAVLDGLLLGFNSYAMFLEVVALVDDSIFDSDDLGDC